MKVMLIKPPLTLFQKDNQGFEGSEPLGLAYLAAYLLKNGHDVNILDAFILGQKNITQDGEFFSHGLSNDAIAKNIKKFDPEIVGISSMFTLHSKGVHNVAQIVKKINPKIPVIVGGAHASALPNLVLNDNNIDILVKGEGENTFLDIISHEESGKDLLNIPGTMVREGKKVKINPPREFIKDLDSIPFPARHLLPMNLYLNDWYRTKMAMRPPRANLVSSRGCTGNCIFCSIHSIWRHTWRGRSAKNVVDEIEFLVKNYGVREIAFQDDNVSLNKERMMEICDEILERKLNIKWCTPNGIAIWTLDKELLDKMKKSGCYKLTFGIETGCPITQKFIRKTQINLNKAKEIIKYCNKIGIWTHSAFIIGFPYETQEQIEETVKFAIDSDLDMAAFFIATPYPATDLFDVYMKEGLLPYSSQDIMQWTSTTGDAGTDTKYLTAEQINKIAKDGYKRFYTTSQRRFMNPLRILRKIHSIEDLRYILHLALMSRGVIEGLTS